MPSSDRKYEQKYKENETYSNRTFYISTQEDVNILKGYSNNTDDFHSSCNSNCVNPRDQDIKYISSSDIVKSKSSENLLPLKNSINELASAVRDNTSTILDNTSRRFSRMSRFSRKTSPGNTKGIREIRTAPNSIRWKDKKEGISGTSLIFFVIVSTNLPSSEAMCYYQSYDLHCEKCPSTEFFLVRIYPYLDTFHVVLGFVSF